MPPKQYKSEEALQSDIVRTFSELYPEKRGQLFHVPNQRNHKLQAFKAKSIGIHSGVADLLFMQPNGIAELELSAIELKLPNSRHKVEHIEQQLEWAKTLQRCGGFWRLCTTLEQAMAFIECDTSKDSGLLIGDVEALIRANKEKKTIKF